MRITLDIKITSKPLKGQIKSNQSSIGNLYNYFIPEVKYPVEIPTEDLKFLKNIPFIITKHSKYISALESFDLI